MGKRKGIPIFEKVDLCERDLRHAIEHVLRAGIGRPAKVRRLSRDPSPFAKVFPVEVIKVKLETGESVSCFLKHIGKENLEHPSTERSDKEVRVYNELFAGHGLPVVKYFGHRWNAATQRLELYLEYIDEWNLKYQKIEHWYRAAAQLGQLHAHFAHRAKELSRCDFLSCFDATYFREWASRASDDRRMVAQLQ